MERGCFQTHQATVTSGVGNVLENNWSLSTRTLSKASDPIPDRCGKQAASLERVVQAHSGGPLAQW